MLDHLNPGDEPALSAPSFSFKCVSPGVFHLVLQIIILLYQVKAGFLRGSELDFDSRLVPAARDITVEFERNLVVDHPKILLDAAVLIFVPHLEPDIGESHLATRLDTVVTAHYSVVDCAPVSMIFLVL